MRWPLSRPERGGRLPSLGQDFSEGHRRYVERMGPVAERWLRTKPFSAPPPRELPESLHVFAHIVERLGLGFRAQVLDVGCGPGWLSEFLARCGYSVTGVDVSEDMVRIARARIAAIREPVGEGIEAEAEFHAMPVREMPWTERFDAAILYDAMHHFDDELATLQVIRRTLVPGGRIFIHEGVRPEAGSEGERRLIAEMEQFGTLESPFEPEYLVSVLGEAGFQQVVRFAVVDDFLDVSERERVLQRIAARLENPPTNTVIAVNPAPLPGADAEFLAEVEALDAWRQTPDDGALALPIMVKNVGWAVWPAAAGPAFPLGTVTIAPYLLAGGAEEKIELPRVALPKAIAPGESIALEVRIPPAAVAGRDEVRIDLVREGIAWFKEYGSPQVRVPLSGA
jgi:SAM-dependent methyltransferase